RTMPTTARQPFGDRSSACTRKFPAALFTSVVSGPSASSAASKAAATASGSRTSHCVANPFPSSRATVSSSGSRRRPTTATLAPSRPSSSAIARPSPVPPPVIRATRPASVSSAGTELPRASDRPDELAIRPGGAARDSPDIRRPEQREDADADQRGVRRRNDVLPVLAPVTEDRQPSEVDVDGLGHKEVRIPETDERRDRDDVPVDLGVAQIDVRVAESDDHN